MLIIAILYLVVISLGVIFSFSYLVELHKSAAKLPEEWKKSGSRKNFRNSIYLLAIFLTLALINQLVLLYLATQHINNGLAFSICFTFGPIPLFAFFFLHTHSKWKRYSYIVLHSFLIGSLIFGGYYNPPSAPNAEISLILNSVFFLIALLHLTDLLIHPKTDHFKFKLKINLIILVFALMASILSSLDWKNITPGYTGNYSLIFLLQNGNMLLFYLSFSCVFVPEIIKLRRG